MVVTAAVVVLLLLLVVVVVVVVVAVAAVEMFKAATDTPGRAANVLTACITRPEKKFKVNL